MANRFWGRVVLVGAGPGDPELITVKGLRFLRSADVVIYDYLANERLLAEVPASAEKIYVGKQHGRHTLSQEQINHLLIEKARSHRLVVRLKGGDPFIFGRGSEEALALKEAGIPFEVVPGITAGAAVLTYAGIPASHRGLATSVSFITGHEDPTKESSDLDWPAIASMHGTLVFYMGLSNLPMIVNRLLENGRSPATPVALVRWGTTPRQQTVEGTLGDIVARVKAVGLKPPVIIVVGDVVALRQQINWFETKPLFGKRIVVTRSRSQISVLQSLLEALGAEILAFSTIEISEPESWQPLDSAIQEISKYDWIVFTSVNGVDAFFQRLHAQDKDSRALDHNFICAIGPATAERLRAFGIKADMQPKEFVTESVVEEFQKLSDLKGKHILLPRADIARPLLKDELKRIGAAVTEVVAYRTRVDEGTSPEVLSKLRSGEVDIITFTSSSTVKNFVAKIGQENLTKWLSGVRIACIGPITSKTAAELGLQTHIMPDEYTIPALVQAIVEYMKGESEKQTKKTRNCSAKLCLPG